MDYTPQSYDTYDTGKNKLDTYLSLPHDITELSAIIKQYRMTWHELAMKLKDLHNEVSLKYLRTYDGYLPIRWNLEHHKQISLFCRDDVIQYRSKYTSNIIPYEILSMFNIRIIFPDWT